MRAPDLRTVTKGRARTIGLGGDGDEVDAIRDVENAFGVALDYRDAKGWITAGDLFVSLQAALPVEQRYLASTWGKFAVAICWQTGITPASIGPTSRLLV